jgi:hypothetical protein
LLPSGRLLPSGTLRPSPVRHGQAGEDNRHGAHSDHRPSGFQ